MKIQEYAIKVLNLIFKSELKSQATKALMFRGLYPWDQDQIMMTNSIKTETELYIELMKAYLKRVTRLLWRKKVRQQKEREKISADKETDGSVTWNQKKNLMELNQTEKPKKWIYFKYRKKEHIRRFCKEKDKNLVFVKTEKEMSSTTERNLKKKEL